MVNRARPASAWGRDISQGADRSRCRSAVATLGDWLWSLIESERVPLPRHHAW